MTAEIIIMNSRAIALAADSAATVITGLSDEKAFPSDDKIFVLTNSAPVGIMAFGKANFMGIPVETIITEYRRRYGTQTFAQLEEYGDTFFLFLQKEIGASIPIEKQQEFIVANVRTLFTEMVQTIGSRLNNLRIVLVDQDEGSAQEIWATEAPLLISDVIEYYRRRVDEAEHIDGMVGEVLRRAEQLFESQVDKMLEELSELEELSKLEFTAEETRQILQVVRDALPAMTKDILDAGDYTGIVLAGFGEEDLFPSYYEYHMEGLYDGVLKIRKIGGREIEDGNDSDIRAFAQTDVINSFLLGINSSLGNQLSYLVGEKLRDFTEELIANLGKYSEEERESILFQLEQPIELTTDSFMQDFVGHASERHYDEIEGAASFMPKEQLAEMAEVLIGLTSLRRRVSFDEETVGGPTSVAVITKSDGLVWIKRKQYFEPGLNPEYLARLNERT